MEIWNGQKDYEDWIEDLEYHMMGLGLTEAGDAGMMLGLFISRGGRKVKEVYNLLKNTPKATVGDPAEISWFWAQIQLRQEKRPLVRIYH